MVNRANSALRSTCKDACPPHEYVLICSQEDQWQGKTSIQQLYNRMSLIWKEFLKQSMSSLQIVDHKMCLYRYYYYYWWWHLFNEVWQPSGWIGTIKFL